MADSAETVAVRRLGQIFFLFCSAEIGDEQSLVWHIYCRGPVLSRESFRVNGHAAAPREETGLGLISFVPSRGHRQGLRTGRAIASPRRAIRAQSNNQSPLP